MSNKISHIYLVDDHEMVRTALKQMIEKSGNYIVSGEFGDGTELVEAYPFNPPPDLIILDLSMPKMNGEQVLAWAKEKEIDIKILILTLETNEEWVIKLFKLGIRGYIKKQSPFKDLQRAIEEIINYGYFHNELLSHMLSSLDHSGKKSPHEEIAAKLSEREQIFLELVCHEEEYTYEQIADIMCVHRRTVDGYRESLFDKLKVKSKSGLVLYAIKHKIVAL